MLTTFAKTRNVKSLPYLWILKGDSTSTAEFIGTPGTLEMYAATLSQVIVHMTSWTF